MKLLSLFLGLLTPLAVNGCVSFSVGAGTGCAWMCEYCSNALGTNNYYFTTDVCTYQGTGCIGTPQAGTTYTCCASSLEEDRAFEYDEDLTIKVKKTVTIRY
jgi:hypothetical protein